MHDKVIIHIPHSLLKLPNEFHKRVIFNNEEIKKLNIFISDYLVDKFIPNNCLNIIKFNYSRLFCYVERFKDDKLEVMSKYGMGVIYENDHNGKKFINIDNNYKNYVISKYYDKHHKLIDDKVTSILKNYNNCYIIDLHSFSDEFVKTVMNLDNNPDICIGYDEKFCNKKLIKNTINHFEKFGYKVKCNYPYKGSLIPNEYYNSKENIYSLMIEINKRIYLDNNKKINNANYNKLKKCMDEYYEYFNKFVASN